MKPGLTALTRMGASSTARGLTRASTAPLTAAMPAVPGMAARAVAAPIRVIDPVAVRCGRTAWTAVTWPQNFSSNAVRSAARSSSANGPVPPAPDRVTMR